MFAVGPSSFMTPYSFYEYTNASGFLDTSTLTSIYTSSLIVSTVNASGRVFMSTIPYTYWVSTGIQTTYPFAYTSSFPCTFSTFLSTFPGRTPPVSTLQSTSKFLNGPYPSTFGYITSSLTATSVPYDFKSTYTTMATTLDSNYRITSPNLWLGEGLSGLINSKKYDVFVQYQYSLWLSTPTVSPPFTWISTTGFLGTGAGIVGRTASTRVQNSQYTEVTTILAYKPESSAYQFEMGIPLSNFTTTIRLQSTIINTTSSITPAFDIFIPGQNNFTFTLVPVLSSVTT